MGRKYKGQSAKTAMMLFGLPRGRKMEKREDRLAIANALYSSTDPRYRALAAEALNPLFLNNTSFALIVEKFGLTWEDVGKEFTRICKIEGMMRQAQHLPELMEQTARDARNTTSVCLDCEGTGKVPGKPAYKIGSRESEPRGEKVCKTCRGEGKVTLYGDVEKLKLVLETFQLIGKGTQQAAVNIDLRNTGHGEQLEHLASSVSGIINGEVVSTNDPTSGGKPQ